MKLTYRTFFFLIAFFVQYHVVGQSYFRKDYPDVWQRATDYTLEVAAAMPASKYGFSPMQESMTFQEQLTHLVLNLSFLSGLITGERPDFFRGRKPEILSKEEVGIVLKEAFGHVGQLIKEIDAQVLQEGIDFGGEKLRKEGIFYLMRDHVTHHRAQAILYLRMNKVEAPAYRGW